VGTLRWTRSRPGTGLDRRPAHLFSVHTTWIGFARDRLLRGYMYDLLALVAPHRKGIGGSGRSLQRADEVDSLFAAFALPRRPAQEQLPGLRAWMRANQLRSA